VYGSLFGIGKLVLGSPIEATLYLAIATICAAAITYNLSRPVRSEDYGVTIGSGARR
jgi:hypothetical protein